MLSNNNNNTIGDAEKHQSTTTATNAGSIINGGGVGGGNDSAPLNGNNNYLQQQQQQFIGAGLNGADNGPVLTPSNTANIIVVGGHIPSQKQPETQVPAEPVLTIRLLIQGKEVGSIIGRGGENVRMMRATSGAKIHISDGSSPERIVSLMGTVKTINKAFSMIAKKFEEDLEMANGVTNKPPITLRLIIASTQCGSIIGKGGSKIREIREKTGASIQVAAEMLNGSTEKAVTISGTSDSLILCLQEICRVLIESPPKGKTLQFRTVPTVGGTTGFLPTVVTGVGGVPLSTAPPTLASNPVCGTATTAFQQKLSLQQQINEILHKQAANIGGIGNYGTIQALMNNTALLGALTSPTATNATTNALQELVLQHQNSSPFLIDNNPARLLFSPHVTGTALPLPTVDPALLSALLAGNNDAAAGGQAACNTAALLGSLYSNNTAQHQLQQQQQQGLVPLTGGFNSLTVNPCLLSGASPMMGNHSPLTTAAAGLTLDPTIVANLLRQQQQQFGSISSIAGKELLYHQQQQDQQQQYNYLDPNNIAINGSDYWQAAAAAVQQQPQQYESANNYVQQQQQQVNLVTPTSQGSNHKGRNSGSSSNKNKNSVASGGIASNGLKGSKRFTPY